MKRIVLLFTVMAFVLCALVIVARAIGKHPLSKDYTDRAAGDNGSFEVAKNGLPANWLLYTQETAGSGRFTVAADEVVAHTGKRSLKIAVLQCSAEGGRFSPGLAHEYDAAPGNYEITYWTKNSGARYKVQVTGVTAMDRRQGPVEQQFPQTTDWTKHTLHYQFPANMKRIRFELNVLSAGTLWVDDVQVIKQ